MMQFESQRALQLSVPVQSMLHPGERHLASQVSAPAQSMLHALSWQSGLQLWPGPHPIWGVHEPFFSGSALGYIPQMMGFALVGSGISLEPGLRISLSAALFLVSGIIGIVLYRKFRHGKSFDDDLERQLES